MSQSSHILSLPQDVITEIYFLLPMQGIAALRQCCLQLQQSISNDKQLWIRIMDRDIAERRISLLPYRRTIISANALAVESWIRNAITLEKAYESNLHLNLDHTIVPDRLSATWAKLIRGRWCLVATSNVYQSWLSLWDGGSTGRPLRMRYSLAGPVMDGLVEDTEDGILLALSIGTRSSHIQVLRLTQWQDRVHIDKLATIDGASHPKVLRGSILGFAVRYGDDSFPRVIDWTSGSEYVLGLAPQAVPRATNTSATVHRICWAMVLWGDYIVAVFDSTVNIYRRETAPAAKLLEVIPLGNSDTEVHVREAHCVIYPGSSAGETGSCGPNYSPSPLAIVCRNHIGATFAMTIHDLGISCQPRFLATKRVWWDSNPEEPDFTSTMRVFIGLTKSKFIFYTKGAEGSYPRDPPRLFFTDIRLKRCPDAETSHASNNELPFECSFGTSQQLPPSDLPLLHFYPCVDFDDARGVLLIATSRGEFWTARVQAEEILTPDSLDEALPSVRPKSHNFGRTLSRLGFWLAPFLRKEIFAHYNLWPNSQILHQIVSNPINFFPHCDMLSQPVPMDLPIYYKYRRDVESNHIPDELRAEAIRTWYTPGCDNLNLPGWSNDWDAFPDFSRWVIPPLRWGYGEDGFQDYHLHSIIALIRHEFCILGDPVPLLYNTKNMSVIFHVGQRIYMIGEGEEKWYNASQMLLTLDEFSSDPSRLYLSREHCIAPSYRDWNVDELQNIILGYDVSVEHAALSDIGFDLDPDPAKWTGEQWVNIVKEYTIWEESCKDRI
ncbi:hypothetical protein BD410DRAFT_839814 [Rickenella mellea]|uniref:F-box domain-containing protein n=1 Tax=Rickenella mellea TaxID=50990 RepID=A0A4Y7Q3Z9_9AGAM|nr:hypothetical protein BD410DRAFT_839814 [Rickenella mellea]